MKQVYFLTLAALMAFAGAAEAAPLIYRGKNPNITPGADPFNASAISERATLTRPKEKRESSNAFSEEELIKRSVLASVSSQITQRLTSGDSTSGSVNFGDGSIAEYSTVDGVRFITITNTITGQTTNISFPL